MLYCDKEYIAGKIKNYRRKAGLTQAELAEKVGISSKQLSRIEIARYVPSVSSFLKLIDILNIDITEFGLERKSSSNLTLEEFIKLIYSLNDKELKFCFETIKDTLQNLKYLQN